MRKFLLKYYALDYMTKCFGLSLKYPKAAAITYPLFAFAGMNSLHGYSVFSLLLWFLVTISLFFEFVYFNLYKIRFSELDNWEDQFQFGAAVKSGKASTKLIAEIDWDKFNKSEQFVQSLDALKFYKPWRFIMHPVIIVALVVFCTLFFYM